MTIIAIDGPAASGKGTLGRRLADHYRLRHLDTGLIYRAVAKALLDGGYSPSDRAQAEDVTETQLHVYALGYQDLTGRRPDYVEIYELDAGKRKPRSVDDEFIGDVKVQVRTAAEALRANRLAPLPSPAKCRGCDYRNMCTAGRKAAPAN